MEEYRLHQHDANLYLSFQTVKENENIRKKVDGLVSSQFTTISIFLVIITFIITNVISLTKNYKEIIVMNLSFLFAISILFSYIYFFIGIQKLDKYKILKVILLLLVPIIVAITLLLFAKNNLNETLI